MDAVSTIQTFGKHAHRISLLVNILGILKETLHFLQETNFSEEEIQGKATQLSKLHALLMVYSQ